MLIWHSSERGEEVFQSTLFLALAVLSHQDFTKTLHNPVFAFGCWRFGGRWARARSAWWNWRPRCVNRCFVFAGHLWGGSVRWWGCLVFACAPRGAVTSGQCGDKLSAHSFVSARLVAGVTSGHQDWRWVVKAFDQFFLSSDVSSPRHSAERTLNSSRGAGLRANTDSMVVGFQPLITERTDKTALKNWPGLVLRVISSFNCTLQ